MDIHEWLAATADMADASPSGDRCIPEGLRAHPLPQTGVQKMGRSYRRTKRKRASSDSSIIAPRVTNRSRAQAAPHSLAPDRARSAESACSASQESSESSLSASPSLSRVPDQPYERRPRHKTRPDRYEPKPKKRKASHEVHKEKKPGKKKRRKLHRSGHGGRTAGLVQNFQLKNGPKNNRLTIKPGATAGVFKHGRASVQVAGRGGLPDLVFNEMKFLQRPAEHQDAPPDVGDQQQQRKKDRKRPNEDEISAYFSAKKPALEQQRENPDTRSRQDAEGEERQRGRKKQRRRNMTPSVEPPSRPFLGFGSKGAQHNGGEQPSEQTTVFTWSESARQPSAIAKIRSHVHGLNTGEHIRKSPQRPRVQPSRRNEIKMGTRGSSVPDKDGQNHHGRSVQTKSRDGALVEVHQPPVKLAHRDKKERVSTTSQSLPKGLELGPTLERQRQPSHSEENADEDYRTSDILRVHEPAAALIKLQENGYITANQLRAEKENEDPHSSFSIDRLLDRARHFDNVISDHTDHAPVSNRYGFVECENKGVPSRHAQSTNPIPVRGEALQAFGQRHEQQTPDSRRSRCAPLVHVQMSLQQAEENVQVKLRAKKLQGRVSAPLNHSLFEVQHHAAEGEEMLDGVDLDTAFIHHREPTYGGMQNAEDVAFTSVSNTTPGIFEAQSEGLEGDDDLRLHPQYAAPRNAFLGSHVTIGRTVGSEMVTGSASGAAGDQMNGFWKPNKLY